MKLERCEEWLDVAVRLSTMLPITLLSAITHQAERETAACGAEARNHSPSPRWLHSLNSRPHFSRARLSAAPFTTSTRRASSFYAFIYAPFIIFKVRLFLAPAPSGGYLFFAVGLPATVCCCVPRFIFIFVLLIMELVFFLLCYYVLACSPYFIFVLRGERSTFFFLLIVAHTELWSLKDNLYYGNLGCV